MDSAIPILLFFGFLVVSIMSILLAGVKQGEAERAKQATDDARESSSRFFAKRGPDEDVAREGAEDSVTRVEGYLRREQRLASAFVSEPSVENLYRRSGRTVDRANLERYLRREQRLSSEFVSEPSIENLYRRSGRLYWLTRKEETMAHREQPGPG